MPPEPVVAYKWLEVGTIDGAAGGSQRSTRKRNTCAGTDRRHPWRRAPPLYRGGGGRGSGSRCRIQVVFLAPRIASAQIYRLPSASRRRLLLRRMTERFAGLPVAKMGGGPG